MANLVNLTHTGKLNRKKGTAPTITETITTTPQIGPDSLDTTDNGEYGSSANSVTRIASTYTTAGRHVVFMSEGTASYPEPHAVVATVSGDAILYGTRVDTGPTPVNHYDNKHGSSIAYDAANDKVLISQGTDNNHGNFMTVGTISGDSISFGSIVGVDTGSTPAAVNSMRPQGMVYVGGMGSDTTNRIVLASIHNQNRDGESRVITISGTTPTAHAVADWAPQMPGDFCMTYVGNGQVVIAYADGGDDWKAKVGTVAGGGTNTITWGSEVDLGFTNVNLNQVAIAYDEQNSKVVIACVDTATNTRGRYLAGTVSGTGGSATFTFSGRPEFETSGTCTAVSAEYHAGAQKILISYKSAGSPSPQVIAATYSSTSGSQVTYTFGTAIPLMSASTPLMTTTSYDAQQKKVIVFRDGAIGYKHGLAVDLLQSSMSLDLSTGSYFTADLQVNGTSSITGLTITESLASGTTQNFVLRSTQGSIPRNFNWDEITNVKWPGGTGPTLTQTNNAVDVFSFTTFDEGTTWYGDIDGKDIK